MFLELKIKDYALIDEISITFTPGLNVLSGETGAGKSIIVGAINLLLGERAATEHIRMGSDTAYIEGIVNYDGIIDELIKPVLTDAEIEIDGELIISREVFISGRSVARVNGRAVPLSFLKELGQHLVDLHGQHQHQSLLKPDNHLGMLDSFGGDAIEKAKRVFEKLYRKRQKLIDELQQIGRSSSDRERQIDLCRYQLDEIRAVSPAVDEDELLNAREKFLANAEKLCQQVDYTYEDLYSGSENDNREALIDRLNRIDQMIKEAAVIDSELEPIQELLAGASAQLNEAAHQLRNYQLKLEYNPLELEEVQERLRDLYHVKKKYGGTIKAVLDFAESLDQELARLEGSEAQAEKLETELRSLEEELRESGLILHNLRVKTSEVLKKEIEESLSELALANARFEVDITENDGFTETGMDRAEFLFSANRGEEVRPLAKIISGGEVARVMLAFKSILAGQDLVSTLIFDEVDSGVGGTTIQSVAEKLARLSLCHQVMCVTHSPQIASMADRHFLIYKETAGNRTVTRVKTLKNAESRQELARMLDGAGINELSLKHIDTMMERARSFKKALR